MDNEALKKINRCFSAMVVDYPFYNFISYGFKVRERKVGTLATDMEHLYYDPEAVHKWAIEELMAVILHEIVHCVFLHPSELDKIRSKNKNREIWMIAQEYVVNSEVYLACNGKKYHLPGKGTTIADYVNGKMQDGNHFHDQICNDKSTEEVYELLVSAYKNAGKSLPQNDITIVIVGEDGKGGGEGEEKTTPQDGQGGGQKDIVGAKPKGTIDTLIPVKDKGAQESEMVERILGAINVTKGSVSARTKEQIEKLRQSQVPWQRVLHRLIGKTFDPDDYRWETPNFRHPLADQMIFPGATSEKVNNVVVAFDTSGSISSEQLEQFLSELVKMKSIVEEIDVFTSDCEIQDKVKLRNVQEIMRKVKMSGRGGTDFRPVFKAILKRNERPPILIYFTDGEGDYPDSPPPYPVLWVLTKQHHKPPFGMSVQLEL